MLLFPLRRDVKTPLQAQLREMLGKMGENGVRVDLSTITTGGVPMGMVDDILKAMDRIPIWKRLGEIPTEVDDLKKRVAALEEKLGTKWPADVCPFCGERAWRMVEAVYSDREASGEIWGCSACNQKQQRWVPTGIKPERSRRR